MDPLGGACSHVQPVQVPTWGRPGWRLTLRWGPHCLSSLPMASPGSVPVLCSSRTPLRRVPVVLLGNVKHTASISLPESQ